jgi:hypothetical protein
MVEVHDERMSSDCTEAEDNRMQQTLFLNWPHHHRTLLQSHFSSRNSNSSTNAARDHTHPHKTPRERAASTCIWQSDREL